jgi:hypothetical protein
MPSEMPVTAELVERPLGPSRTSIRPSDMNSTWGVGEASLGPLMLMMMMMMMIVSDVRMRMVVIIMRTS